LNETAYISFCKGHVWLALIDLENKWFLILEICQREELECASKVRLIIGVHKFWAGPRAKLESVYALRVAGGVVQMNYGLLISAEDLRSSASKGTDHLDFGISAGASGRLSGTPENEAQII
jgi:hypothetical protein